ncbi:hypothetical protein D3C81_1837450 [compost metagenome]
MTHRTKKPKLKEINLDSKVFIIMIDDTVIRFNLKFVFVELYFIMLNNSLVEIKNPRRPKEYKISINPL